MLTAIIYIYIYNKKKNKNNLINEPKRRIQPDLKSRPVKKISSGMVFNMNGLRPQYKHEKSLPTNIKMTIKLS
jgi:hypothetical protein